MGAQHFVVPPANGRVDMDEVIALTGNHVADPAPGGPQVPRVERVPRPGHFPDTVKCRHALPTPGDAPGMQCSSERWPPPSPPPASWGITISGPPRAAVPPDRCPAVRPAAF